MVRNSIIIFLLVLTIALIALAVYQKSMSDHLRDILAQSKKASEEMRRDAESERSTLKQLYTECDRENRILKDKLKGCE
jgi:hypothetical protein